MKWFTLSFFFILVRSKEKKIVSSRRSTQSVPPYYIKSSRVVVYSWHLRYPKGRCQNNLKIFASTNMLFTSLVQCFFFLSRPWIISIITIVVVIIRIIEYWVFILGSCKMHTLSYGLARPEKEFFWAENIKFLAQVELWEIIFLYFGFLGFFVFYYQV